MNEEYVLFAFGFVTFVVLPFLIMILFPELAYL